MKHRVKGRKFSRVRKQRRALIKTLLGSFIMREKIITTEAKAKEIRPIIEKMINKVKKIKKNETPKQTIIRELKSKLPSHAAEKMSGEFIGKFEKRNSGYLRIIRMLPRKSDGAKMVVIEFV